MIQVVSSVGNDGIIIDSALLVSEDGETGVVGGKASNVSHHQLLNELNSVLAVQLELSHISSHQK